MTVLAIVLAVVVGALMCGAIYLALQRKRSPSAKNPERHIKKDTGAHPPKPEKTDSKPKDKKDESHGHGHGGSFFKTLGGWTAKFIFGCIALFLLIWLIGGGAAQLAVFGVDTFANFVFSPHLPNTSATHQQLVTTVPLTQVSPPGKSEAELRQEAADEQKKIEDEKHTIVFDHETPMEWIELPLGGYVVHYDSHGFPVYLQCANSAEKPPKDAPASQYPCSPIEEVRWSRALATSVEEGPVNLEYNFKKGA